MAGGADADDAQRVAIRIAGARQDAGLRDGLGVLVVGEVVALDDVAVIAEVKRSSPSKGSINPTLDLERQVVAYEAGGAAAISILTEPKSFGGSNDDLLRARAGVGVAILKKDFHVEVVQILEARALGASAALVGAEGRRPGSPGILSSPRANSRAHPGDGRRSNPLRRRSARRSSPRALLARAWPARSIGAWRRVLRPWWDYPTMVAFRPSVTARRSEPRAACRLTPWRRASATSPGPPDSPRPLR